MTTKAPRVRFAPSPTGFLHIGGARTALFNFLFAKRHSGKMILRIEDTDRERSTDVATEAILDGMRWLGLTWDEGPFFQSKRNDLYSAKLKELVDDKKAYRCYCTPEELDERRKAQRAAGKPPKYDGRCRKKIDEVLHQPHTIRFLVPKGTTKVEDLVKGDISFENETIEDLVLARSDGFPTYNFVVVVDDSDMRITHVIRGDDHLNNTPKQILLYEALGADRPKFAHVPLILGPDKKRLSKRHGATSVQAYRDMGYLPQAMNNFLVRLGWSYGDQEVFSMEELQKVFDLTNVGTSAGVFNPEKLLWLNQHYMKNEKAEVLLSVIEKCITVPEDRKKGEGWKKTIDLLRDRAKTVEEMAQLSRFYFLDDLIFDEKAVKKFLPSNMAEPFLKLRSVLEKIEPFDEATIKPQFEKLLEELQMKMGNLAQPLRVALTGGTVSPGIFEVLELLGKDRVLQRIDNGIDQAKAASA